MPLNLTTECQRGFDAGDARAPPYVQTSPADDAFRIGRWMGETGRPRPQDCSRSRGSTYRIGDLMVSVAWAKSHRDAPAVCVIQRVS